ncbi:MAG: hypothetical protein ACKV2U_08815 [Bryobacteraceae bacterium]
MNSVRSLGKFSPAESDAAHFLWKIEGADVQIWLSLEVVHRIREYLTERSGRNPKLEMGGLLLGMPHPEGVQIDNFAPLFGDGKAGWPGLAADARRAELRNYIENVNRSAGDLSVVGYFRSDLRKGICLYDEDLKLIKEFFPDRSNVFLIIRPGTAPHPTAGFFFWENDSVFSSCSFMEFDFDERTLASDSERVANAKVNVRPAALAQSRGQAPWIAAFLRRGAVGAGIAVTAYLALGAYLVRPRPAVSPPMIVEPSALPVVIEPVGSGLSVSRSGTEIGISWNDKAPIVRGARRGRMTIKDGRLKRSVALTAVQLRSSRLSYSPKSDTVEFTFELFAKDGKVTRESVIAVLDVPVKKPVTTKVPIEVRPARAEPPQKSRNPVRAFVPPPRTVRPVAATPIEPPPLSPAAGVEVSQLHSPIVQPSPALSPSPVENRIRRSRAVLQSALLPPVPIKKVSPVLPPSIKRVLSSRTNVKVRVQIDAWGRITAVEPLPIDGPFGKFLGAAAADAARRSTFEPAREGWRKVPGELTLEFVFVPDKAKL